jgi:hypothetical protein
MPNHSRRITISEYSRWEIAFNDRTGGHYSMVSNSASRHYQRTATDPNVSADDHSGRFCGMCRVDAMMICVIYSREVADERVVADFNVRVGYNGGTLIDEHTVAYAKLCRGGCRPKLTRQEPPTRSESLANCNFSGSIEHRKPSVT